MEGSRGVIREERGCSGLSSEAKSLLHTEADLCDVVIVSVCVFAKKKKRPHEISFQVRKPGIKVYCQRPKVIFCVFLVFDKHPCFSLGSSASFCINI